MKRLLTFCVCMLLCTAWAFGQQDTAVVSPTSSIPLVATILKYASVLIPVLIVALEAAGRLWPTKIDLSLINKIKELFDLLIPNKHVDGGTHQ